MNNTLVIDVIDDCPLVYGSAFQRSMLAAFAGIVLCTLFSPRSSLWRLGERWARGESVLDPSCFHNLISLLSLPLSLSSLSCSARQVMQCGFAMLEAGFHPANGEDALEERAA